jgi:hypothetical protein
LTGVKDRDDEVVIYVMQYRTTEKRGELKAEQVEEVHTLTKYEGVFKVSGLAIWSENCKLYSSVPLSAVVSLFCGSVW